MTTEDFLAAVCGDGLHVLARPKVSAVSTGGEYRDFRHVSFTISGGKTGALPLEVASGGDLFFAPATFEGDALNVRRRAENVTALKAIWCDLDFKNYESTDAAMVAFRDCAFLKSTPPSAVVSTGGGLHVYWVLEAPIVIARWKSLAQALADTVAPGLKIDRQVTVNAATLLRVPGSYNTKYSPPRLVKHVWLNRVYTEQQLRSALLVKNTGQVVPFRRPGTNDDLVAGVLAPPPPDARFIADTCPTIKDSLDRGGNGDSYHLWKNILHVLAFCEGGEQVARDCSTGDPRFDEKTFQKHWRSSRSIVEAGGGPGPTTCQTFSTLSPHCATCPFRGSSDIVSPISLGKFHTKPSSSNSSELPVFYRDNHTYATVSIQSPDGELQRSTIRLTQAKLSDFEVDYGQDIPTRLRFTVLTNDKAKPKRVAIDSGDISDMRALDRRLADLGVPIEQPAKKHFKTVLETIVNSLILSKTDFDEYEDFGWNKDKSFSIGHIRFVPGRKPCKNNPREVAIASYYKPTGSFDKWRSIFKTMLESDTQPALHMVCAMSIASPLMNMANDKGVTLAVFSSRSGTGKSTALKLAASVWGDPKACVFSMNDTANAAQARLGTIHDLPMFWDEIRMLRSNEFVREALFRAAQGRTKSRANIRGEVIPPKTIRSPMILASNYNLMNSVAKDDSGDTAGFYRMMQVEMLARSANLPEATRLMRELEDNYRFAGMFILKHVVDNYDKVYNDFYSVMDQLTEEYGMRAEERYWRVGGAMMILGARIAAALGIEGLNETAVRRGVSMAIQAGRARVASVIKSEKLVAYNIAQWAQAFLLRVDMAKKAVTQGTTSGVVKMFYDVRTYELYLPFQTVEEYCRAMNRDSALVHEMIRRTGGVRHARGVIGAGTSFATMPMDYYILDGKNLEQALPV